MHEQKTEFKKLPKVMDCPYHHCLPDYAQRPLGYTTEHIFYCVKCKEENPNPGKFNSFGYGFTSQYTKSAARANWNNAVHRRQLRMLKDAIRKG